MSPLRVGGAEASQWVSWSAAHVVDVGPAAFSVRTYLEQAEVRRYLDRCAGEMPLAGACDVGAGFGRLLPVLHEKCARVVAFEREPALVSEGRRLLPFAEYRQVDTLERLPSPDGEFDFALSFTVLQHLVDRVVEKAALEIKRVVRRPGFVLLCEETDESHRAGDLENPAGMCTIGRAVRRYVELMAPFELIERSPRRIEPTYPRQDVGAYMLFRAR